MNKKQYHVFNEKNITKAANAVKNGMSYRKAEKKFGVPKSSIRRRVKNKQQNQYGRPPVFNNDEERKITECIALAVEWGFPLTSFDIRCIVKKMLDKNGLNEPRFKNNMPEIKWIKGFLKRQSEELKGRLCKNIKRATAGVTPEVIESYFSELAISLKDVSPEAIINYDETSIQDDPGKSKVIVKRKCKRPERIMDFSKSNFSVMFAGTASSIALPPYIVYKADNMYNTWTEGGPVGARFNRSKSGWFEGALFEDWFMSIALPYFKKLGDVPKAIIGDNLSSHLSVGILEACIKYNIRFILLPPNSTHLCQPLDLAFFSPLKTTWRKQLTEWKEKFKGTIRKDQFARLLKKTFDQIESNIPANLKAGFLKSGIFPLNKNKILVCLPKVSYESHDASNNSRAAWTTAFQEFLKETRTKETSVQPRKKKINITLGKSVSEGEFVEELKAIEEEKTKDSKERRGQKKGQNRIKSKCLKRQEKDNREKESNNGKKRKSFHDSISSNGDEDWSVLFDDEVAEEIDNETSQEQFLLECHRLDESYEQVDFEEMPSTSANEDDFVVVTVTYDSGSKKESRKQFIAKVIKKHSNGKMTVKYRIFSNVIRTFFTNFMCSKMKCGLQSGAD
ncbi:uncharacterized protein [Onthophagus taurus]|uniref:uncharacterized protein n=1 Tax=Onthophagus taurus TaxID=166361 RepID=UPI0039BDA452